MRFLKCVNMLSPTYWLCPDVSAHYSINDNTAIHKDYACAISIKNRNVSIPEGLTIDKWNFTKKDNYRFLVSSSFKLIASNQKIPNVVMKSRLTPSLIEINSPFNNLELIGNDLSFASLIFYNSLTLRCSSFLIDDVLYIFCGKSGSGKTCVLSNAHKKYNTHIQLTSDDHLTLKTEDDHIKISTPYWDDVNIKHTGVNSKAKKVKIFFLDRNAPKIIAEKNAMEAFLCLAKNCVLFASSKEATEKIIDLCPDLLKVSSVFYTPPLNCDELLNFISGGCNG